MTTDLGEFIYRHRVLDVDFDEADDTPLLEALRRGDLLAGSSIGIFSDTTRPVVDWPLYMRNR
jgi:hypothetical protein